MLKIIPKNNGISIIADYVKIYTNKKYKAEKGEQHYYRTKVDQRQDPCVTKWTRAEGIVSRKIILTVFA